MPILKPDPFPQPVKPLVASKSIWFGVITAVLGVIGQLAPNLPPELVSEAMLAVTEAASSSAGLTFIGVLTIILRILTKSGVRLK